MGKQCFYIEYCDYDLRLFIVVDGNEGSKIYIKNGFTVCNLLCSLFVIVNVLMKI